MENIIAGLTFGVIIGYLSWYAFRPGETKQTVPLDKLGAFIGIVGGATIITMFPTGTSMFAAYAVGLLLGFFFTPIKRYLDEAQQNEQQEKETKQRKEIETIHENWATIERVLDHKLGKNRYGGEVTSRELHELPYTRYGMIYLMRRYAQLHIDRGVEFELVLDPMNFYPKLIKHSW